MKMPLKIQTMLFVSLLSLCQKSVAQQEDVFNLSLAQLADLNVSVASNFLLSLKSTPGIVRVVDSETIANNGWNSLEQILMHVPGVQISVSKNGHSNIWMRGVQNRNNNKVLLLVDGVPQHDLYYGNFHITHQLPVQQIEKIEILSGPGGVVHGANSFAGVIAIHTKKKGKSIGFKAGTQTSYASISDTEQSSSGQIFAEYDWNNDYGDFYVFANHLQQDGFQPQLNRKGEFYSRDTSIESRYYLGKYQYKDFSAQINYSDYSYPYINTKSDRWQGYDKQTSSIALDYLYSVSDKVDLKLSAFHRDYDFKRPKTYYDETRIEASGESLHDTSEQGLNATFLWPISDQRHVSFGINFSKDWARSSYENNTDFPVSAPAVTVIEASLVEDASRNVLGFYTEFQQHILGEHWLHLGLRHDELSDFESQSNYRISLTHENDAFYYKLLLGTSYRVPSYREYLKKYNSSFTQKNPLQPEQIRTLELATGFTIKEHEILLVWYSNHYEDFIKEVNVNTVDSVLISADGDEYGFNFDEIEVSGLELSWLWKVSNKLNINTSLSHILEATEDPGTLSQNITSPSDIPSNKTDLMFLADNTTSLQLNYSFNASNQLYWDIIYYSDRGVPSDYQTGAQIQQADNSDGFWLANIHLKRQVNDTVSVALKVENVFDENIYSPTPDPASDYDNQWSRRYIDLSAQWVF